MAMQSISCGLLGILALEVELSSRSRTLLLRSSGCCPQHYLLSDGEQAKAVPADGLQGTLNTAVALTPMYSVMV